MKEKRARSSNIELLRIVAMFAIVVYHIVFHCVNVQLTDGSSIARMNNGLFNYPVHYKRLWSLVAIMPLGPVSNAIFLLISGYFMVERGKMIDIRRTAEKLLAQLGFASALLLLSSAGTYHLIEVGKMNIPVVGSYLIDQFRFENASWYVGYYFAVVLIGKAFLNKILNDWKRESVAELLLVLFALAQFAWSGGVLENLAQGLRTLTIGLFFYSLGGYIKRYNPFDKVRLWVLVAVILVAEAINLVSFYNLTANNIENYLQGDESSYFVQQIPSFGNHSIVPVAISIVLFEIFRRIRVPSNNIINFLGSATFMVYLIHDNNFFYAIWNKKDWITLLAQNWKRFLLQLVCWALGTFLVGVFIYIVYLCLARFLKYSKHCFIKDEKH